MATGQLLPQPPPTRDIDPDAAIRTIVEGTAAATGRDFFRALVESLAAAFDTYGAWVTEYLPHTRRLRALAFRLGDEWLDGFEQPLDGTPCQQVIDGKSQVHIPDHLLQLYPDDAEVRELGVVSYLGVPLLDAAGCVLGHLAVLDRRPLHPDPRLMAVFQIFAARAAAEHQRLAAEARVRDR